MKDLGQIEGEIKDLDNSCKIRKCSEKDRFLQLLQFMCHLNIISSVFLILSGINIDCINKAIESKYGVYTMTLI